MCVVCECDWLGLMDKIRFKQFSFERSTIYFYARVLLQQFAYTIRINTNLCDSNKLFESIYNRVQSILDISNH